MINVDPDIWLENPYDSNPAPGSAPGTVTGIDSAAGSAITPMTAAATGAKLFRTIRERAMGVAGDDRGMSTVEYALGTVAAAAFGALLYTVVTGGQITDALTDIIERALNTQ